MTKVPEVSEKNKKNEILDAYNALLKEMKEQKKHAPKQKEELVKKHEEKALKVASTLSQEEIIKTLASVKVQVGKSLDQLEEKLIERYREYMDLETAIDTARRNLEEIHSISVEAESLAALVQCQQETKDEFEVEMEEKREELEYEIAETKRQWEIEQEEQVWKRKEELNRQQIEQKREEEEYKYQQKIMKQKDSDAYQANKLALEKELEEKREQVERELTSREQMVAEKEERFDELSTKVESFPEQLQKAIAETRKETTEKVQRDLQFKMELSQKEMEGERKLFQQRIESLESKIKEQEQQINQLTQATNKAGQQVQSIAVKAIEGASFRGNVGGFVEVGAPGMKSKPSSEQQM